MEPTSLLNSTNQTNASERKGAGVGESWQWEILKSIVYGGLIESITSLGVVSSAAGAGAGTCKYQFFFISKLYSYRTDL